MNLVLKSTYAPVSERITAGRLSRGRVQSRKSSACRGSSLRRTFHIKSSYSDEDLGFESGNLRDLKDDIEVYLKQKNKQDVAAVDKDPEKVIGSDVVSDEEARDFCQRIVKVLKVLREKRRMGLSEVQLTIEIEQPEEIERNKILGIEDVPSREERALALARVTEGKIPENRLALKFLCEELESWPFLEEAGLDAEDAASGSQYEQLNAAQGGGGLGPGKRRMGRDPAEKPQALTDMLPDWVGYSFLYLVSAVPVLITISVIGILFFSSLK